MLPTGFDIKKAFDHVSNHPKRLLEGFTCDGCQKLDLPEVLFLDCDIFISPQPLKASSTERMPTR